MGWLLRLSASDPISASITTTQNTFFSRFINTKGVRSTQAMERVRSFDNPFLLKSPYARQAPKAHPGHSQIQHLHFKMQSEADDAC